MTPSTPSPRPESGSRPPCLPYYAAFRPRYAPEFSTLLAERFGLDGTRRALDLGADSGRGLLLVTALAEGRGVTDRRSGPGKTVWASVSAPRPPAT